MSPDESIKNAKVYIVDGLKSGIWPPGARLPSVKELARAAHVSNTTMISALHVLKDEGAIAIHRRIGMFAGHKPAESIAAVSKQRWQLIRHKLQLDIVSGTYAEEHHLPLPTTLAKQYGVSINTIKKVLKALVSENIITLSQSRYKPAGAPAIRQNTTIVFAAVSADEEVIRIIDIRMQEFIQALERFCAEKKIQLRHAPCQSALAVAALAGTIDVPFGYIIWNQGLAMDSLAIMLDKAVREKRPAAIIDLGGQLNLPKQFAGRPLIKVITLAAHTAGAAVGNYLLAQGHKHIGYLCGNRHGAEYWSTARLTGLKQAFCRNDPTIIIEKFNLKLELETVPLSRDVTLRCAIDIRLNNALSNLEKAAVHLSKAIQQLPEYYKPPTTSATQAIGHVIDQQRTIINNRDLFRSIAKNTKISALVAENDGLAITTINGMKDLKRYVPEHFSIIGFDNYPPIAYQHSLTSYDFAFSKMAHSALSYIINPGLSTFNAIDPFVVEGFLVVRKSSDSRSAQ